MSVEGVEEERNKARMLSNELRLLISKIEHDLYHTPYDLVEKLEDVADALDDY